MAENATVKSSVLESSFPDSADSLLPDVITDYLDLLLREGTEPAQDELPELMPESVPLEQELLKPGRTAPVHVVPEHQMERFECLRFTSGKYQLLTPLDRIQRIDFPHNRLKFNGLFIPECIGESEMQMELFNKEQYIYFHKILDVVTVESQDVIWRPLAKRAPWFVGTHKQYLCRVFDPYLLVK
jgi:hypothetical protein